MAEATENARKNELEVPLPRLSSRHERRQGEGMDFSPWGRSEAEVRSKVNDVLERAAGETACDSWSDDPSGEAGSCGSKPIFTCPGVLGRLTRFFLPSIQPNFQ